MDSLWDTESQKKLRTLIQKLILTTRMADEVKTLSDNEVGYYININISYRKIKNLSRDLVLMGNL